MTESPRNATQRWLQIGVVAAGLLIFVLLLFAERTALDDDAAVGGRVSDEQADAPAEAPASEEAVPGAAEPPAAGHTAAGDLAVRPVPESDKEAIEALKVKLKAAGSLEKELELRRQIAARYRKTGNPGLAASVLAPALEKVEDPELTLEVARGYTAAIDLLDETGRGGANRQKFEVLNQRAIQYYEAYTETNPDDIDARIDLALRLADTTPPMKGIFMLRDIAEENPDNFRAQFTLGVLSIRTQQWPKAEQRLRKALSLRPESAEVRYYLATVLLNSQSGNRQEAKQLLQRAKQDASEAELKQAITELLNGLN